MDLTPYSIFSHSRAPIVGGNRMSHPRSGVSDVAAVAGMKSANERIAQERVIVGELLDKEYQQPFASANRQSHPGFYSYHENTSTKQQRALAEYQFAAEKAYSHLESTKNTIDYFA